jgi:hypothetical protein
VPEIASRRHIDAISEELGGFTIDNDSTPNNTTVNEWITEVESIIVERGKKLREENENI